MIKYDLLRSDRKTVAIYIRNGIVEVRAPLQTPLSELNQFVATKEKWIQQKLAKSQEQTERRAAFALNYGNFLTVYGKQYPLVAKEGNRAGFDGTCFYMPPNLPPERIKELCVSIYRRQAQQYLTTRTLYFAKCMNLTVNAVKINNAQTRWGSCSSKKNINFSWRLIMADSEVIDYVVVHELSHIYEMNHSGHFWSIVKNILPDYQERKSRLKELQTKLREEDWK